MHSYCTAHTYRGSSAYAQTQALFHTSTPTRTPALHCALTLPLCCTRTEAILHKRAGSLSCTLTQALTHTHQHKYRGAALNTQVQRHCTAHISTKCTVQSALQAHASSDPHHRLSSDTQMSSLGEPPIGSLIGSLEAE